MKIFKYIFGTIAGIGLFAGMILGAKASSPYFNTLPGDYEMLRGRNVTTAQENPVDPVTARVGDVVEGVIYYHNNVAGTTAYGVHVSVKVPTAASNTLVFDNLLWADGVAPIGDTIIDGHVVGPHGLTINVDQAATAEVVPESVRWFPDRSQTPVSLINNQNGSELFTGNGLNLGDIAGCWEHAGFVMFKVKLVKVVPGQPVIEKAKSAFNDTQHVDARANVANAGDQITYTLVTKNSGSGVSPAFVVTDGINDILDYADVVSVSDGGNVVNNNSATIRDDAVQVVYPAIDIAPGQTVNRTFVVKVKNPIPTTAQNGTAFDFAMFNKYGNNVIVVVAKPTTPPSPTPTPTPTPAPIPSPTPTLPATGVNPFGYISVFAGSILAVGRKLRSYKSN